LGGNGFPISIFDSKKTIIENSIFEDNVSPIGIKNGSILLLYNNTFKNIILLSFEDKMMVEMKHNRLQNIQISLSFTNITQMILDTNVFENAMIHISNSSMKMNNCSFSNSIKSYNNGSAIFLEESTFSITDSYFLKNVGICGGAIFCKGGYGEIFYSTFMFNNATEGGAIFCDFYCTIFFDGNQFQLNHPEWEKNSCGNVKKSLKRSN